MEQNGRTRLVNKSVNPQEITPQQAQYTPMYALSRREGFFLLGYTKAGGVPAFLDLDRLVIQPLVWAEQQHILGILDGREEDYDLQTLTTVLGEAPLTPHTAQLTVPAGQVWFINAVETVIPASGGANVITANWRCSLWTDRAAVPSTNGQAFHPADLNFGVGGGTQWDEFGVIPLLWAATNKPATLRLPAGTVLTVTFTNTVAAAAAAVNCLFRIYGSIGKLLVT